jgi:hypothetical protein
MIRRPKDKITATMIIGSVFCVAAAMLAMVQILKIIGS